MAAQDEPAREFRPDRFTDEDADLLLAFLQADLVGKFGAGAVSNTYPYDVAPDKIRRWPCLIVARSGDRRAMTEDGGTETTTWLVRYVAPMVPMSRLKERWPILRAMYERMHRALGAAQSPFYNDGLVSAKVRDLGEWKNIDANYQTLDTDGGVVPVLSIRASVVREFVLDFSELDDLQELVRVDFDIWADAQDGTPKERAGKQTLS